MLPFTTPRLVRLACAALALALPLAAQALPGAAADAAAAEREFETAQALFRQGRFAGAYGRFMNLADRGHAEASLMAWAMHRWSQELFNTDWEATALQRCAWATQMREAVRP